MVVVEGGRILCFVVSLSGWKSFSTTVLLPDMAHTRRPLRSDFYGFFMVIWSFHCIPFSSNFSKSLPVTLGTFVSGPLCQNNVQMNAIAKWYETEGIEKTSIKVTR